jgi:hypothetical protein
VNAMRSSMLAIAVLAIALLPARLRSEESLQLIVPPGALQLASKSHTDIEAKFTGTMWVSGVFLAEWETGVDSEKENITEFWIVPDRATVAKLPHFAEYEVTAIQVEHGLTALKIVSGPASAADFAAHKIRKVKVQGRFQIDRYSVGVECDAPWATARVIAIDPPHVALTKKLVNAEGC